MDKFQNIEAAHSHRRHTIILSAVILLMSVSMAGSPGKMRHALTRNGKALASIVLTSQASATDEQAARGLQSYLAKISGTVLPILRKNPADRRTHIWIVGAGREKGAPYALDWSSLEEDGFTIRSEKNDLLIAGGYGKGTLYGVYTLLESYLGCRKYSPTVVVVPRRKTVEFPPIDLTQVPRIKFRDACWYDPGYMDWHKLDNHDSLFGMYAHTFARLVPPERYFKEHPEYFSLTPAGRIPDGQLCLTNPDVFSIVVDRLQEEMQSHPTVRYWSVSQNDTFNPCQCDSCRAIDSLEGSPSGSLLAFVNRVAARFPDKIISTLAYQYSRSAPKHLQPAKNVNIMLCSIECNRSRPIDTDTSSASFRKDVDDWTALTNNIYLWDYVVQFRNLVSPFPNLRVLQPNIRYFVRKGITALFEQGSGTQSNEFKELRTYLIAKLLWDPDIKIDSVMDDFLLGYYGDAAPFMRRYIDTMHDSLAASGENLGIYGFPLPSDSGYLSPSCMDAYGSLFDQAEAAVASDTGLLRRVRTARLPLQFALLEQAKLYGQGERGFFELGMDSLWHVRPAMEELLETFCNRCIEHGITDLDEAGKTPAQYLTETRTFLSTSMRMNLALFKPVSLTFPASRKYHKGDSAALTDGLRGLDDYHLNWLGFYGTDMEATIDLGSIRSLRKFSTSFLQDSNAWIFLPTKVELSFSEDGVNFERKLQIERIIPQNRRGIWSVPYDAEFRPIQARYVRVTAINLKTCPPWHKGAAGRCWIFSDEITIE